MLFLLLGVATVVLLMMGLGAFSRAQVRTIKQLGIWIIGLGLLVAAVLLAFTGKGLPVLAALGVLGPMIWRWLRDSGALPGARLGPGARPGAAGGGTAGRQRASARRSSGMTREEAYAVLGLAPGANEAAIREAHHRLMRTAHPDAGGSDWLAARINQARDALLG